ncbi:MAG TPA: LuxR C-terminal-related transcriptional regulator [Anaerovoracaceae bacterium]|nr:LuxR C-terminal-related transcriptional regulator [Anaerovoracaceae bacterium]
MSEKKKARLNTLSEREKEVLNYLMVDKDTNITVIARDLDRGEQTIRGNLTEIYRKLEVEGEGNEKRANLVREYLEDYTELFLKADGIKTHPEGPEMFSPAPPPKPNHIVVIIGVLSGFLIISIIAIAFLLNTISSLIHPQQNNPIVEGLTNLFRTQPPTLSIETLINERLTQTALANQALILTQASATPTITFTPSPTIIPTNTPIPPTATPKPTNTPLIPIPYKADFSQVIGPEWNVLSGNWYMKNNSLTVIPSNGGSRDWIFIDEPILKNYRLKLTVNTPYMGSAGQGDIIILVRYDPTRSEQIGLFAQAFVGGRFGIWSDINGKPESSLIGFSFSGISTYTIEILDSNYTLFVNGQSIGSIVLDGFDGGGIGLSIACGSSSSCPSVSNLSIEPLP